MSPDAALLDARARATDAEPRWRVAVDGPSVEIQIRGSARPSILVPALLLLPVTATCAVASAAGVVWIVAVHVVGARRVLADLDETMRVLALVAAVLVVALYFLRRCVATLLWVWDGSERVTITPEEVRIERDALGIHSVTTVARQPHAERRHDPPIRRGGVFTLRGGLPRPAEYGRLRVTVPGHRGIRFGLDVTGAEAAAIVAEIDLIRGASERPIVGWRQ